MKKASDNSAVDSVAVEARLRERLRALGISAPDEAVRGSTAYLALLHRWNQRLNLTGFDLTNPTQDALDRLVIEPIAGARLVRGDDRVTLDIGTGGGSPAIPLKLACPWLRAVWFESRTRKAAFLREAVRVLGLTGVEVVTGRFGDTGVRLPASGSVDVVTLRAVRVDLALVGEIRRCAGRGARLILFSGIQHKSAIDLPSSEVVSLWFLGPEVTVTGLSEAG